jgi:hypothetical protein
VNLDATSLADGDQLADPGMRGDCRGQGTDGRVAFGLADQPGQLTGKDVVLAMSAASTWASAPTTSGSCGLAHARVRVSP